jgi:hypothetical protein
VNDAAGAGHVFNDDAGIAGDVFTEMTADRA